jgi:hypothetical protein
MRRAPQLGQKPRRLQLNATSFSWWQDSQRLVMACQFGLELRPVLTDDVVEQGGFGPVADAFRRI